MKKLFLFVFAAAALFSCENENEDPNNNGSGDKVLITNIEFREAEYSMNSGETVKAELIITPSNATNVDQIVFSSLYENVATVDARGNVMADTTGMNWLVGSGETEITASVGSLEAKTTVKVILLQDDVQLKSFIGPFETEVTAPIANPNFDPALSFEDYQDSDSLRAIFAYCDSIRYEQAWFFCNDIELSVEDGYYKLDGAEEAPMFLAFVSFGSRSASPAHGNRDVSFILTGETMEDSGFEVDPNWTTYDYPAAPYSIMPGSYNETLLNAFWDGAEMDLNTFTGSTMEKAAFEDRWLAGTYPIYRGFITDADVRLSQNESDLGIFGASKIDFSWALPTDGSFTDYAFTSRTEDYPAEGGAARNMPREAIATVDTEISAQKAMQLSLMTRIAKVNPEILK